MSRAPTGSPAGVAPPASASHVTGLYLISGVCGLVDATCYLDLGEVFAEMMTGNLLLIAFYAGTGHPFSDYSSNAMAVVVFIAGAMIGGRIARSALGHTRLGFGIEWLFLASAAALSLVLPLGSSDYARRLVVATLSFAMGLQNALLRKHGVPDLATNVMTLTLTALVADSTLSGGANERWRRRFASISLFVACAMLGALLTHRIGPWAPLTVALVLFSVALIGLTRPAADPAV